jgi:hypothetical protein
MSEIGNAIDAVIRGGLAPLMKREGFKKSGRNFLKVDSESVAVLNVQASTSNLGATGKFTINLGRYFPSVARAVGDPDLQGRPKEYDCHLRQRIGFLLPKKLDHWWEIGPETHIEQLAVDVTRVVEGVGLPWLRRVHDLHSLKTELEGFPSIKLASVLLLLGERAQAESCLEELVRASPMAQACATAWAKRHGLHLA